MPPVTERVAQMRQGRAPQSQSDNNARNIQSQVSLLFLMARLEGAAHAMQPPSPNLMSFDCAIGYLADFLTAADLQHWMVGRKPM